jgi:hypothetical protein
MLVNRFECENEICENENAVRCSVYERNKSITLVHTAWCSSVKPTELGDEIRPHLIALDSSKEIK